MSLLGTSSKTNSWVILLLLLLLCSKFNREHPFVSRHWGGVSGWLHEIASGLQWFFRWPHLLSRFALASSTLASSTQQVWPHLLSRFALESSTQQVCFDLIYSAGLLWPHLLNRFALALSTQQVWFGLIYSAGLVWPHLLSRFALASSAQ